MEIIFIFQVLFFRSLEEDIPEFLSVDEWLKYINMEKYSETFTAANINTLNQIVKMEENDLKALGIKLIGHRNKISKSIKAMKSQFHNKGLDGDEAAIWFIHSSGKSFLCSDYEVYQVSLSFLYYYDFFIIRIVVDFLNVFSEDFSICSNYLNHHSDDYFKWIVLT